MTGDYPVTIPEITRKLKTPSLGDELLWGGEMPPDGAPKVYVVAINGQVGSGLPGSPDPSTQLNSAYGSDSIGLILHFNNFCFYTAGNLPSEGDEAVATELTAYGLPDSVGSPPDIPTHICSFKCGQEGGGQSTSTTFLETAKPTSALISSGYGQSSTSPPEEFPAQKTVDDLTNCDSLQLFYLTNCNYEEKSGARFFWR